MGAFELLVEAFKASYFYEVDPQSVTLRIGRSTCGISHQSLFALLT
jgi:hypothetical protein